MKSCPYDPTLAAEIIIRRLRQATEDREQATLAVPGGRSPGPVLAALSGMIGESLRGFLHLLWVDERAVPAGHPDRNDRTALAAWSRGGAVPGHIHPMPAELRDLEKAAAEYAKTINRVAGRRPIDVCLLGVGEDGHVASLFPDHPSLDEEGPVLAVYDSPKPPPCRLTFSLPMINRAGLRVILAPGAEKGAVYRRALSGPDRSLPASLLSREGTLWFVDNPET